MSNVERQDVIDIWHAVARRRRIDASNGSEYQALQNAKVLQIAQELSERPWSGRPSRR